MRKRLWIDLETRSTVDLRVATPYRYAEDRAFRILMAYWSNDGKVVHGAFGREQIDAIPGLWDRDVLKVAHNAPFERICLSRFAKMPVGTYLPADQFHDTQAVAGELGWPQSLSKLAKALGADPKDEAGTRLINLFCKPRRDGGWNGPDTHPAEWLDFCMYCEQDVYTLIDVDQRLGDFPTETERAVYLADQAVNDAGARIDMDLARRARDAAEANRVRDSREFTELTGVANPNSNPQALKWLKENVDGPMPNLRKETVEAALERDLSPEARRALELRQELALVASKKYSAALSSVSSDGRLRGSFRFFGAHTGRWTGRGTQMQNLPRAQLSDETTTEAAILDLALGLGGDAFTLKALVRSMFAGPLTVVDYSAIEARVIAWLAGERWALQAFRDGRDIYVETAERMSTEAHPLGRSQGKVAVLALGYAGGVNSLRHMGAEGDDDQLQVLVRQWRRANARIVRLWNRMEDCVETGGQVGQHIRIERNGTDMAMQLPSGRAIHYHGVRWERYQQPIGNGKFVTKEGWRYTDPKGMGRIGTYGGRLAENATQAVARDIMAEAMVRLVGAGHTVVGHVHDEVIVEGTDRYGVEKLMVTPPEWSTGLPIAAEGFVCSRYRKG